MQGIICRFKLCVDMLPLRGQELLMYHRYTVSGKGLISLLIFPTERSTYEVSGEKTALSIGYLISSQISLPHLVNSTAADNSILGIVTVF